MRNHRTTAELQEIVGPRRSESSPKLIASAERELAHRAEGEEAIFQRKLTRSGVICAAIGAFCLVWPALILLAFFLMGMGAHSDSPDDPFIFRHFNLIFVAVGCLQFTCGVLLLSGGLAVRSRKRIGPLLIAAAILLTTLYIVAFTTSLPLGGFTHAPWFFVIMFSTFSVAWGVLLLFLLWIPFRFFVSHRVKQACDG